MGTDTHVIPDGMIEIYCRYIVINGKRIYPKNAKVFHFFVKAKKGS
jgi:hypothetical protein